MEQLEAAGVEARITGGGRIKHDSATKTIFIFGCVYVLYEYEEIYPQHHVFNVSGARKCTHSLL